MVSEGVAPDTGAGAVAPASAGVSVAGSTTRSRTTGAAAWWAQAVNPRAQAVARRRRSNAAGSIRLAVLIERYLSRIGVRQIRRPLPAAAVRRALRRPRAGRRCRTAKTD